MTPTRHRRVLARAPLLVGSFVLCTALTVGVAPAGAGAAGSLEAFVGQASAVGSQFSFVVPKEFAVEEVVNFAAPLAQSRLDALGGESSASLPYPGGNAVAYQGLLNVATGVSSPFAYPAHVQASSPGTPSQDMSDPSGTYRLFASADSGRATGLAHFQPEGGDAFTSGAAAVTSVVKVGDKVTATAESVTRGVTLGGGVLQIGFVRSRSATTFSAGEARPVTTTELAVDGLRAGDMRLGVGPEGFVALGRPVPASPAVVTGALRAILEPAGVQLRLVQATMAPEGASAAALEVVFRGQFPGGPAGITTLRLGGATSSVVLGDSPLPAPPSDDTVPATKGSGAVLMVLPAPVLSRGRQRTVNPGA